MPKTPTQKRINEFFPSPIQVKKTKRTREESPEDVTPARKVKTSKKEKATTIVEISADEKEKKRKRSKNDDVNKESRRKTSKSESGSSKSKPSKNRPSDQADITSMLKNSPPKKKKHDKSMPKSHSVEMLALEINSTPSDDDVDAIRLGPSSQAAPPRSSDIESDDDEPMALRSPTAQKRRQQTQVIEISDGDDTSDDSYGKNRKRRKGRSKRLKRKSKVLSEDEEEEDSEEEHPRKMQNTGRGRLKRGLKPVEEEMEVMDDLDDDVVLDQRFRKPKKSQFTKNLERRRRQRQGLPDLPSSSEEEEDEPEVLSLPSDEDESEENFVAIPGSRKADGSSPTAKRRTKASSTGSEDVENFIVSDEEVEDTGYTGPQATSLPLQFAMVRAQPLAMSFKVVFQLLVHVACQPRRLRGVWMKARLEGENETAAYFNNGMTHLRRQLDSIRDSQVVSSLWSLSFKEAFQRPVLRVLIIGAENYCVACRRTSAISTRRAVLSGERYEKWGFEPIGKQESDDEDEGSEEESSRSGKSSSDSDKSSSSDRIPEDGNDGSESEDASETVSFNLGQHCARRISLYHEFTHWEYHLFQIIDEYITELETLNRERLKRQKEKDEKRRQKGKEPKKRKEKGERLEMEDPDSIVDWLEKKGIVAQQWSAIQSMMERAKTVEMRNVGEIE